MAKSSKELVNDLLKQNKLSDEAKAKFEATAKAIAEGGNSLDQWEKLLRQILTEIDDIANQADFVKQSFQDSIQALSKQNIAVNLQRKALRGISSIAGDILDIRLGESKVSTEILKKLEQQLKARLNQLTLARTIAIQQGKAIDAIDDEIAQTERLIGGFERMQEVIDKTNNDLGFTPKILGGIDKALQKMGFEGLGISDAIDQVQMMAQRADAAGVRFDALGSFTSIVFKNIKNAVSVTKILELLVLGIFDTFKKLDESTGKLAKQLGQSYNETKLMKKEFSQIAKSSENLFITTSSLTHSFETLADRFGTIGGFSEATLKAQTELVKQAGYSEESAAEIAKFSLITGEASKDLTASALGTAKAFNMQNGLLLNEKALLEDALKTSSAIQVSFGNSTDELILAVATAKKFGLQLSQVEDIAGSLLDFESSISNELEAELLLGKNINLEKARQAALDNDLATVAEEIANQVGSSAEFAEMNRIQQEAIAKSVGLSREDLAKSLQEQEAIAKLGGDAASSQEAYANMLAKGLTHEQIAKKLGDDKLLDQIGNTITYFTRAHVVKVNESQKKSKEVVSEQEDENIAAGLPSQYMMKYKKDIKKPIDMAKHMVDFYQAVQDEEQVDFSKNQNMRMALNYLKKAADEEETELGKGGEAEKQTKAEKEA